MTPDPAERENASETTGDATETTADATDHSETSADSTVTEGSRQTGRPEQVAPADDFDWRGWLLVGIVFVSVLVIPTMVLYIPEAQGAIATLGLSQRQAYLALPMIPAIVLGVTAVWASLRAHSEK